MSEKRLGIKQATGKGFIEVKIGGVADFSQPTSVTRRGRVQGGGDISPTITTTTGVCKIMSQLIVSKNENGEVLSAFTTRIKEEDFVESPKIEDYLYKDFGVFKLTERECGRLMAVRDSDIDKMAAVNCKTALYSQFGNSIVVTVLMAIFSQLNIKGVIPWNNLNQEQREELIERTTI